MLYALVISSLSAISNLYNHYDGVTVPRLEVYCSKCVESCDVPIAESYILYRREFEWHARARERSLPRSRDLIIQARVMTRVYRGRDLELIDILANKHGRCVADGREGILA